MRWRKKTLAWLLTLATILPLTACGQETASSQSGEAAATQETNQEELTMTINVGVNGSTFSATLEQNEAARTLWELLPLTLTLGDYAGFEKVGALGTQLPTSDIQTTTSPGDIVLFNGDQIVMFYGANSWSYTRLGRIDDLTGWAEALGGGDVTVTLSR